MSTRPLKNNWDPVNEEEGKMVGYVTTGISSVIIPVYVKGKWKLRKVNVIQVGSGGPVVGT